MPGELDGRYAKGAHRLGPRSDAQSGHRIGIVIEDVAQGRHLAQALDHLVGEFAQGPQVVAEQFHHEGLRQAGQALAETLDGRCVDTLLDTRHACLVQQTGAQGIQAGGGHTGFEDHLQLTGERAFRVGRCRRRTDTHQGMGNRRVLTHARGDGVQRRPGLLQ